MSHSSVIETILSRTTVRTFTGAPISNEQVDTLLRCAMAAPSAMNHQPWAFIVIDDPALLRTIGERFPNTRCQNNAPLAILPCGDLSKAFALCPDFWIHDLSAATQNILLAAHAQGLGAVWAGIYPHADRVADLQSLLHLPEHIVPLCVVAIGHPAESPEVKDKYDTSRIHFNQW